MFEIKIFRKRYKKFLGHNIFILHLDLEIDLGSHSFLYLIENTRVLYV